MKQWLNKNIKKINARIQREPKNASLYERRSRLRLLSGDCLGGWQDILHAFTLDPQNMAAYAEGDEAPVSHLPVDKSRLIQDVPPVRLLIKSLDKKLARQPRCGPAWAWRAALKRRALDYTGALTDLNRAWSLGTRSSLVLTWRGEAKIQTMDVSGGMKDLKNALKRPCSAWNYAWCGRVMLTMLQDANGMRYLDKAIKMDPSYGFFYAWRAVAKKQLKSYAGLFEDFERALILETSPHRRHLILGWRGIAYLEKEDYKRALADLNKAVRKLPRHAPILYARSQALRKVGRLKEWIIDFDKAASLNSKYLQSTNAYNTKELESLIADIDRVLRDSPKLAAAKRWRGLFLSQLGRFSESLLDLENAVSLNPTNALTYSWLGDIHGRLGNAKAALDRFNHSLRLDPTNALTRAGRAKIFIALGKIKHAQRDFDSAARMDPHCAPILAERGCLELMIGRPRYAAFYLQKAVSKNNHYAQAHTDLGLAQGRLGMVHEERRNLKIGFALDPSRFQERIESWALHWEGCGKPLTRAHKRFLHLAQHLARQ